LLVKRRMEVEAASRTALQSASASLVQANAAAAPRAGVTVFAKRLSLMAASKTESSESSPHLREIKAF